MGPGTLAASQEGILPADAMLLSRPAPRRFMRFLSLILLIALAFAGCAEDGGPATDGPEQTAVDEELQATDDTGVIRGVVVDETVTPVVGAAVFVKGVELEATTNEDGSFGFSDLEPGTYFLEVSKIGFDAVQSSVEVVAGVDRPDIVRVQMVKNPTAQPFVQTSQYAANLLCGVSADATAFGCSVFRPADPYIPENNAEVKDYDVLPDWMQVEMFWESTQPLGEALLLNIAHCCDNGNIGPNGTQSGTSPLTAWVVKSEMEAASVLEDGTETRVFPTGLDGTQVTRLGFGVVLDQQVEWFTSEFFNFTPDEGWTFIADGAHPIPQ